MTVWAVTSRRPTSGTRTSARWRAVSRQIARSFRAHCEPFPMRTIITLPAEVATRSTNGNLQAADSVDRERRGVHVVRHGIQMQVRLADLHDRRQAERQRVAQLLSERAGLAGRSPAGEQASQVDQRDAPGARPRTPRRRRATCRCAETRSPADDEARPRGARPTRRNRRTPADSGRAPPWRSRARSTPASAEEHTDQAVYVAELPDCSASVRTWARPRAAAADTRARSPQKQHGVGDIPPGLA